MFTTRKTATDAVRSLLDDERIRRVEMNGQTLLVAEDVANAMISQRLAELEDPALELVRTRQAYEQEGYNRQWIDQRMRCVSARHELTSEWYRRGARESDHFRALTNAVMHSAFGMDVEAYRRHKSLFGTRNNLRDHMNDLELSLTALAETTAVELHRRRDSRGFDALLLDVKDAGGIVARTRSEIERQSGASTVSPWNYLSQARGAGRPPTNNIAA
jgi:DNA-damage-inducible protein D